MFQGSISAKFWFEYRHWSLLTRSGHIRSLNLPPGAAITGLHFDSYISPILTLILQGGSK